MLRFTLLASLLAMSSMVFAEGTVQGQIQLDPKLASKVKPDDTVFIFARASKGPRMPLAVFRAKVKDLPMQYHLDDSMAMQPGMNLSMFDQVVVVARVSSTGEAMPQSGDLEGSSKTVAPGKDKADVTIDKVLP